MSCPTPLSLSKLSAPNLLDVTENRRRERYRERYREGSVTENVVEDEEDDG